MTRKTYGLIAGFVAATAGMWWWRTRAAGAATDSNDNGRVIFDNTPRASTPDGNL